MLPGMHGQVRIKTQGDEARVLLIMQLTVFGRWKPL